VESTSANEPGQAPLGMILAIGTLQGVTILFNLLRSKVIAVLVGPEGVGIVSIVDQLVVVVQLLSVGGIPFSALTILSRAYSEGPLQFRRSYLLCLTILLGFTLSVTGIAVALVTLGSDLLTDDLRRHGHLVLIGLLTVPAMALKSYGMNVFAAGQHPRAQSVLEVFSAAAFMAAAAIGIEIGHLPGLYWGNVLAALAVTVAAFLTLHRQLGLPFGDREMSLLGELRQSPTLLRSATIYYVVSFSYPLAWLVARHTVLSGFGEAKAGFLQGVTGMAAGFGMLLTAVTFRFFLPAMSAHGDTPRKFWATLRYQRQLVFILALLGLPFVLFPGWILSILYSPAFSVAAPDVHLFILAEAMLVLAGIYLAVMLGLGDVRAYAAAHLTGPLLLALISWWSVAHHGARGVGLAAIAASATILLTALVRLHTSHGFRLPPRLAWLTGYVLVALAGIGTLVAGTGDDTVQFMIAKSAMALLFVLGLISFSQQEDRVAVRELCAGLIRGKR
jgi:antigen flippase